MYVPYRLKLLKRRLLKRWEGPQILKDIYTSLYGKDLDLKNPLTFSQKIFHRMIEINRHGHPVFTKLADKCLVRDYVQQKIGAKYLVEMLWHGADPRQIPFDRLPEKCVVKTNHGSGGNIVLNGQIDRKDVINRLQKMLKENYYWTSREFHYYKIPPKVLVEPFLEDHQPDGPLDYRFWCFGGEPEVIQVDNHSHNINPFYDIDWNLLPLHYRENSKACHISKPENFDEMLDVARKLSADFDFVRVDLYNLNGEIKFGEMTFTPAAGRCVFKPEEWDTTLGQKWIMKK
jgi:hypothetical protein